MGTLLAVLSLLLAVVAVVLLLMVGLLYVQVVAARPTCEVALPNVTNRPRLAVLIPAHDESVGLLPTLSSVVTQLEPFDRLLVVADNCSDDTAAVAAGAGAEVVERLAAGQRGKGYALDFGVRHLAADPPEIVVIVDADCTLGAECLSHLAWRCTQAKRPVQALYLMKAARGAELNTRLAEFAWVVKNEVRPLGGLRLGLPCQLMGSGMAFSWAVIRDAPLASGHLVEDLQLGLDLAFAGAPPQFCPAAKVFSHFPSSTAGASTQRARWERGHWSVIARQGHQRLRRAIFAREPKLVAMVLDLCVPPLVSLAMLLSLCGACAAALWLVGGNVSPLAIAAVALALLSCTIAIAWCRFGRGIVSARELLAVPSYVLAKVPIYARLLVRRQTEWIRTKRDDGTR
jgi:cellulose synthase/poly-beta-1,6-N-acetylglucosamine synthase-like glycosyltransferase